MRSPQPRYIIKADDYGRGPLLDHWRRFIDLCLNFSALPSIGVVGSDFAPNRRAHVLARFAAENYGVEFWNHSYRHASLLGLSSEARMADTRACHDIIAAEIGRPPIAYGAPFNAIDLQSAKEVVQEGSYCVLYDSVDDASGAIEIPRRYYLTPEIKTQAFRPIRYPAFRTAFDRRTASGVLPLVVLQVHPPYWSDECFGEFQRVLQCLVEHDFTCVTAAEYAESVIASRRIARAPATLGGLLTAFESMAKEPALAMAFAETPPPNEAVRILKRLALSDPRSEAKNTQLAEFGAGAGLWSVAASTLGDGIKASAFVADEAQRAAIVSALADFGQDVACEFPAVPGGSLPDCELDFLIGHDVIAPETAMDVLALASRSLRFDARLLLGMPNEVGIVATVLGAAQAADLPNVLHHLDRWFALAARRAGLMAPRNDLAIWNDHEFSVMAMYGGFQPMLRSFSVRPGGRRLLSVPLYHHQLLIRTAPSAKRAAAMLDGEAASIESLNAMIAAGQGPWIAARAERWAVESIDGLHVLGLAVQAEAAGGAAAPAWHRLRDRLPQWSERLEMATRSLIGQDWLTAAALLEDALGGLSQESRTALGWLAGRRAGNIVMPADLAPGLSSELLELGSHALAGEVASMQAIADRVLAAEQTTEWLLRALAGPSPDSAFAFVEAAGSAS